MMKKTLAVAGGLALAFLLTSGPRLTPYVQPYHRSLPEFGEPAGVTCCCSTGNGGTCCAEVMMCGGYIPGCLCRR